jgi:hypothetical protein
LWWLVVLIVDVEAQAPGFRRDKAALRPRRDEAEVRG